MQPSTRDSERRTRLAAFLWERRDTILEQWRDAALHRVPRTREIPELQLLDYIPPLLDRIAELVDQLASGESYEAELPYETAERHALDRLEEGFDLVEVIAELTALRDVVLRLWQDTPVPADDREHLVFNQAVDRAIMASVERYVAARDRVLEVLDLVSSTSLQARTFDDLLQRLVAAFREAVPSVDTVGILIREGDELRVRAAAGLDGEVAQGFSLRIGEGFAGEIAARKQPLQLSEACHDPIVLSKILRSREVQALYGVPLIEGGNVIGVAHMGSKTAHEFSQQDRLLFGIMVARATAGIYQYMLREDAQRRARALEESERRFRATFENAAVGISHNALDGTWLRLNRKYCELLGYSEDELLGSGFQQVTHPDDLAVNLTNMRRLLSGEAEGYTMEKRYVRKDGRIIWADVSVALVRDDQGQPEYMVAAARDITEQRTLRHRLTFLSRASEILGSTLDYEKTLEQVAQLAVPVIADWCAVDIVEPGQVLGDFMAVAHRDPQRIELLREARRRYPPRMDAEVATGKVLRTGEPELIERVTDELLREYSFDETHYHLLKQLGGTSFMSVPLLQAGRVIGALTLANSESGRTFGSDDLVLATELARRASAAIENARLHAKSARAVQLRDQILGIVSHDLRNPIGTISLAANVLQRNRLLQTDPNAPRQIEVIQRNTRRAARLINDLLDISSIQGGNLALEVEVCELSPLVLEAIEAQEPFAREEGIDLEWNLHVDGQHARCDRDRVIQVFANLIGNAVKFCSRGDHVSVGARIEGREALFSVEDSGPGIPREEVEHIFDLYWKGGKREGGTGLGLFITKGIVDSQGGRIWVKSTLGEGTSFYFTLPLCEPPNEAAANEAESSKSS